MLDPFAGLHTSTLITFKLICKINKTQGKHIPPYKQYSFIS